MKKLYLLASIIILSSCKQESKVDYAMFSGTISNSDAEEVTVRGEDFAHSIAIKEDGTFADTLKITEKGYYLFSIGRERSTLYLDKGSDLKLTINTDEFDESISYSGIGADENNFLAKKYMLNEELAGSQSDFYSLKAEAFKAKALEIKNSVSTLLDSSDKLNAYFVKSESENNRFDYLLKLNQYKTYHQHYAKVKDLVLPNNFLKELDGFDFKNEASYKSSQAYRDLVNAHFSDKLGKYSEANGGDYTKGFVALANEIPQGHIKQEYMYQMAFAMLGPNEHLETVYKMFMDNTTNEDYKKEYTEKYEKLTFLAKGKPSPTFDYENHKGGTTSLETDLKGKYVYIDVWATWCAPCIAEIPSLKKIETAYHDKNIVFVSISVDRSNAYETWRTMVTEKELGGVQLFAKDAFNSKFITDYGINAIPRFILIGPDGNIVSADAPRPSSPNLVKLFEDLKI